jgi:transposase
LHLGVDVLGLPHAFSVTTADFTDREGAIKMVEYYKKCTDNLEKIKKILVDGGYTGEKFANAINSLCGAEIEIAKRNELHSFAVIPKRWIVERSFGWLNKYRRLWKNCEHKLFSSLQMVSLAFMRLLLKRC